MSICPFAVQKLIPPGSNDPRIKPRVAILHVAVSVADSLYEFFRDRSGGVESHFYVALDGTVEQYRDTGWQADANFLANDFAVSIETAGMGVGKWNDAQLAAIKRLLLWLNVADGIPLQKCPTWDGSGVGYHVQFGSPGKWTPVAKSCPGPDRIEQFLTVLVPWMRDGAKPTEAEVQLSDRIGKGPDAPTVGQVLNRLDRFMPAEVARDKADVARDKREADFDRALPAAIIKAMAVELKTITGSTGLSAAQIERATNAAVQEIRARLATPAKP